MDNVPAQVALAFALTVGLAACETEPPPDLGDLGSDAAAVLSGKLVGGTGAMPGTIAGVHYRTATQSGFTAGDGAFSYADGETITFSVSDVDFHATTAKAMLSPWQLATAGTCTPSDELTQLLVFLYSLDTDGDPANGTQITPAPIGTTQRAFSELGASDVAALVQQLGGHGIVPEPGPDAGEPDGGAATMITGQEAVNEFIHQMDGETWKLLSSDLFQGEDAVVRTQGVATDGTNWIFSYAGGLEVTDQSYTVIAQNLMAIPSQLGPEGITHIGDIDYDNGRIYAGMEDEDIYLHPTIGVFDDKLSFQQSFALPLAELTGGCPWVAADAANGHLLTSQYGDADTIDLFDMMTGMPAGNIPLSTTIHGVQGAKLFEGSLYASTNDGNGDIYKIDMATGVVTFLMSEGTGFEEEGCVFLQRADGSLLHTLDNNGIVMGVEFRHHQRTREPLRKSVCP